MSRFWIDITNAAGNIIGPGPIITASKWHYTQRLSRAGEWSLEVPAYEPRLDFAALKTKLNCYTTIGGVKTWLGGGTLDKRVMSMQSSGEATMVLSGNDLLYDLARETLRLEINYYTSVFMGNAIYTAILAAAPGWTATVSDTTPQMTVRFVDESVLNALTTITNKTGQMFRLAAPASTDITVPKLIRIFSGIEPTGILATNLASPIAIEANTNACLIVDIERQEDAFNLVNKAIPYGAGQGQARLTVFSATQWPDGTSADSTYTTTDLLGRSHTFTVDKVHNYVFDSGSYATYGSYSGRIEYKEIAPITNSDADMAAAANALLATTVQYLLNASIPQEHYTLRIAGLRKPVYPGQSLRVVARQVRDGRAPINIDQDLIILETQTEIDASGVRTVGLTVATTREFAQTDAQIIAAQIQTSLAYQAHPQTGPNSFTVAYREDVDVNGGATFPFWLSRDTLTVNSVTLRFKLEKLRSTVRTIGGTASGSVSIPSHSHSVSVPSHHHDVDIDSDATTHGFARIMYFDPTTNNLYYDQSGGSASAFTSQNGGGATVTSGSGGNGTVSLDISNALSAVYGVYEDPNPAYVVSDLAWTVNGSPFSATPSAIGDSWYEMDITSAIVNSTNGRPLTQSNTVAVSVSNPKADTHVRVTAQIEIRNVIQSIAVV